MGDSSKGGSAASLSSRIHGLPNEGNNLSGVRKLVVGSDDFVADQKDFVGVDTTIPLSPQWLITKSADGKIPPCTMESPRSHGGSVDFANKERWRAEGNRDPDNKRKDWWRTATDADINANAITNTNTNANTNIANVSRRDVWKEEERDNIPVVNARRDRWKEGADDSKRSERRNEAVTSNRDPDATRRVSKWTSRWGPDDKEKEVSRREKRQENEKDGDNGQHRDRQHSTSSNINRNEADREVVDSSSRDNRAWRSHSIALRSKAEAPLLSSTPPKYAPGFGVGRGRGENSGTGFVIGRGRAIGLGSYGVGSSIGAAVKSDIHQEYRYPRAKLLDVYRRTSESLSFAKLAENFIETPELTQAEPVAPLALVAPDVEEGTILDGIGKGDIVSSGASYTTTKGTRNREEINQKISKGVKAEAYKEIVDVIESSDASSHVKSSEIDTHKEGVNIKEDVPKNSLDTKKELEQQEEKQEKLFMDEVEHKESQQLAGLDETINMECGNFVAADERSEMCDKHIEMQFSEDLRTDTSMEHEERKEVFEEKYVSIPPEELSLYYTDPQGMIQGPFLGADIMCWFELGYFGLDLPVRLVDAPEGASFSPLGDVMPHLKIKTETPLQFDAAEPTTEREGQIDETSLMPESLQPVRKIVDDSELVVEVPLQPVRQIEDKLFEPQQQVTDMIPENAFVDNFWNMSKFSEAETSKMESPKLLLRSQQWQQNPDILPEVSSGYPSPRLQTPRSKLRQPDVHPMTAEADIHPPLMKGSSHGLDEFHAHKLLQLEKQHLQQKRDFSLSLPARQHSHALQEQQRSLLELLNQQKTPVSPLDQLIVSDANPKMFHPLPSPHPIVSPHHQPSASHPMSRLQQSNIQGLPTELNFDQLLRMQQQQHQHQPQHALFEHLLKPQQHYPLSEPLPVPHAMQDMHMHQLEQRHQRFSEDALLELLLQRQHEEEILQAQLQRQQEEELLQAQVLLQRQREEELLQAHLLLQRQREEKILVQAQQRAHLLQQQQLKLDEQRVSGVWEVDEFGQFVRTQASVPVHSTMEPFQQHQMHMLNRRPSFSHEHHPQVQNMPAEVLGFHNADFAQSQHSKGLDIRTLMDLQQAERDLSTLMLGASRMDVNPLAGLQGQRTRFEGHSNLPSPSLTALETELLTKNQAFRNLALEPSDGSIARGWRPHEMELRSTDMYEREPRVNQNIRQQMFSAAPWQQDSAPINDYMIDAQGFPINPEHFRHHSGDNQGNMSKILQHQEMNSDYLRQAHSGDNQTNILARLQQQGMNPEYLRHHSGDDQGNIVRILQEQQGKGAAQLNNGDLQRILDSGLPVDHGQVSMFANQESSAQDLSNSQHWPDASSQSLWVGLMPSTNVMATTNVMQPGTDWPNVITAIRMEDLTAEIPEEADSTVKQDTLVAAAPSLNVQTESAENSSIVPVLGDDVVSSLSEKTEDGDVSRSMDQVLDVSPKVIDDTSYLIENKDVKKNKKKAAKVKAGKMVGSESSPALTSPGKLFEVTRVGDELPNVLTTASGPSFGDFLPIKDGKATAPPSSAWSLDPHKQLKTTKSLREIQDLDKKNKDEPDQNLRSIQSQVSALPTVSNPVLVNASISSAWQKPLLSPALPVTSKPKSQGVSQTNLNAKLGVQDKSDGLFWDNADIGNSNQPSRVDQSNLVKNEQVNAALPSKTLSGNASTGQQSLNLAEARAFRHWCEEQIKRFSGKGHMSLLEFCMGLPSAAEAGDYLAMYLGDGPLVESFKAEFLRRKESISAEAVRIVFPTSEAVIMGSFDGERREGSVTSKAPEVEEEHFEVVRSGKKKGKKGKKVVDPSLVLGFNVSSSSRILMGEIQHIED